MTLRISRAQSGVGLIEVLIAMVVLSIGLLGLAGVQLTSMRSSSSALAKTQANTLGNDILDRMRANRGAALAGDYNTEFDSKHGAGSVAEDDLSDWKAALAEYLPGGQGRVEVDDSDTQIQIRWREDWADEADKSGYVLVNMRTRL